MSTVGFGDILGPDDPAAVDCINLDGAGDFLIVCDHGGREIPKSLGDLGLSDASRSAHIAWDIGAKNVGLQLSQVFDAPMISGCYSRLVYDLNRYPWDPMAMAHVSDSVRVPGNENLSHPMRQRRYDEIARPYYSRVFQQIKNMKASGRSPVLISIHTMTNRLSGGAFRDEAFSVLSDPNDPFSRCFLKELRRATKLNVGDNVPFELEIGIDFTVPECTHKTGIPAIMFELRQDLTVVPSTLSLRVDEIVSALRGCFLL